MSNLKVVSIAPPKVPSDLSKQLRELADSVDRGEVDSLVLSCVKDGDYAFMFAASLQESLVLATLLKDSAVRKFRHD